MITDNINEIFIDYLKKSKTQYAILINGSWGSGKTFFWEQTLQKTAKDNGFKTIYISLNGISKIEHLEQQLFVKLIPLLGKSESGLVKNTITLISNIVKKAPINFLKMGVADLIKGLNIDAFNFHNYVICFDDLERCQISLKEILGFINNYVEHKNLKAVILADELKMNSEEYDNIKEKVIRQVLTFEINISEVVMRMIKEYELENVEFYNFLKKHETYLVEMFLEYNQPNLRIILSCLDVLEKIFFVLKDAKKEFVEGAILFSVIILIEFKTGNLNSSQLKNYQQLDLLSEHYYYLNFARVEKETSENENKPKQYAQMFHERYLQFRIKDYFFYPSIYSYILSGYIKLSDLRKEITDRKSEIITEEISDFRQLLDFKFRELTDIDFIKLTENVLKFAGNGKYELYDYAQIANFYYYFSENELIEKTTDEITNILHAGLNIVKLKKQIDHHRLENLLHFGDKNPAITSIKNYIKTIHQEIEREQFIKEADELVNYIRFGSKDDMNLVFKKHKFSASLIQYSDVNSLANAIITTSNSQIFNLTQELAERYRPTGIGAFLYADLNCLTGLEKMLTKYLSETSGVGILKRFLLMDLTNLLKDSCNKLEDTKTK